MIIKHKDQLYAQQLPIEPFQFNQQVADCFEDMINRSVPGYGELLHLLTLLAQQQLKAGAKIYDLGCSLGALSLLLKQNLRDCQIIAVDHSAAMLNKAKQYELAHPPLSIEWRLQAVEETEIHEADWVVLNFTLQFIAIEQRLPLLKRIRQGLKPDGALILSEKIKAEDEHQQRFYTELHEAFKRNQGYSELEIAQKRAALEQVLQSESWQQHEQRLRQAGFERIYPIYQNINFISLWAS